MPNEKWRRRRGALVLALALLIILTLGYGLWKKRSAPPDYGKPWLEFSGEKALTHVQALVDLGPRPSGSEASRKARAYIRKTLENAGWQVDEQSFSDQTPDGSVSFVNLIARQNARRSSARQRFLLASHYDTKTFDSIRFVGANDGGSSTGALLEMARVLNLHPPLAEKIDLVFFDGEEAYEKFTATDGLYGSRYFAKQLQAANQKDYRGGVLWDMIGDRDLAITLPPDSPAQLARGIFAAAEALHARNHFTYSNNDVLDDHSPLNTIGVPTIDLIDFDYPPWHTAEDTMDKLSAGSLQTIGAVTAYYLAELAFK